MDEAIRRRRASANWRSRMAGKNEAVTDFFAVISRSADPSPRCNMQVHPIFCLAGKKIALRCLRPCSRCRHRHYHGGADVGTLGISFPLRVPTRWLVAAAGGGEKSCEGRERSPSLLLPVINSLSHTPPYPAFDQLSGPEVSGHLAKSRYVCFYSLLDGR